MDKQEYLDTKIKPIFENLIFQIVCEKPENPVDFMINWLQKTGGYNPNGLTDKEMEELNMLRIQLDNYKEKEKKKIQELNQTMKEKELENKKNNNNSVNLVEEFKLKYDSINGENENLKQQKNSFF